MVERQRAADRGQHFRPVAQQVERHDRRQEQQRQEIDDGIAALGDAACHASENAERLAGPLRRLALQLLETERRQAELLAHRLDHRLQALRGLHDVLRRLGDQAFDLAEQRRHDRHRRAHRHQHGEHGHHGGGPGARQAETVQPHHHRIEEIGNDGADHERQQDVVQQPQQQQKDDRRAEPEAPAIGRPVVRFGHRACSRH